MDRGLIDVNFNMQDGSVERHVNVSPAEEERMWLVPMWQSGANFVAAGEWWTQVPKH